MITIFTVFKMVKTARRYTKWLLIKRHGLTEREAETQLQLVELTHAARTL